MLRVADKVAIVTGAAGGLGGAIARRLSEQGARLVLTDINGEGLVRLRDSLPGEAVIASQDVTDEEAWRLLVTRTVEDFGGLDVLVNNAGVVAVGTVEETTLEDFRRVNAVHSEGTFLGCKHALPAMRESGDGSGSIIARVDPDIGAPEYNVGDEVWVSGAGSRFGSDFQITVGWGPDFTNQEPADLSPPAVFGAFLIAPSQIQVRFNEPLDNTSASNPANYSLSGPGGATVEVVSASHSGTSSNVDLFLADSISSEGWSLTVTGVRDLDSNPIVLPQTVEVSPPPPASAGLDGPARTFLPREGEEYPVTMTVGAGLLENGVRAEILLRVFDLQGRLERTLYDSRFAADPVQDFRDNFSFTVEWDGRDDIGEFSTAGAYIIHLSVVDQTNGKQEEVQMPVVVASRLKR